MGVAAQAATLRRKPRLLGSERPLPGPGPEAEEGEGRPALRTGHTSASPAAARAPGRRGERLLLETGPPRTSGASAGRSLRRAAPVAPLALGHEERRARHLQLSHDDEERRVEDLGQADARPQGDGEVEQRDELGHPLEQRRLPPLAAELVERLLVLEDDGRAHDAASPRPARRTGACACACSRRSIPPGAGRSPSP